MMMMLHRPKILTRMFLLILCWSFVHAKYSSSRLLHRFLHGLHFEEKGEQPLQVPGHGARHCGSHTVLRNHKIGIIGANLLKLTSSKGDKWQGYQSALKVANIRGGSSSGVATSSILASPVTCVLAVIASVGLRMLQQSAGDHSTSNAILVTVLQRLVNSYLIGWFFFALVQWQMRVQEQNSKR